MGYEYFVTLTVTFSIMLVILKFIFTEIEARMARKQSSILWFLQFSNPFIYRRNPSVIMLIIFMFLFSYTGTMFTGLWVIQLVIFLAVGMLVDAFSQVLCYYYAKLRFKNKIRSCVMEKAEIEAAMNKVDDELVFHSLPNYDSVGIIQSLFQEDLHVSISSMDGGEFVSKFETLPPITYVVESSVAKAEDVLKDRLVKITTMTPQGTMPFKDGKIDLAINEIVNYDKYDMHRILKSDGYLVVEQLGSDNYKEILNMFIPFRMKGRWDKENCIKTLQEVGFEIQSGYEDFGYIRFKSLSAIMTFIKQISPDKLQHYDIYINFYAHILNEIKRQGFFDLTTHKFMVIAKKKEIAL